MATRSEALVVPARTQGSSIAAERPQSGPKAPRQSPESTDTGVKMDQDPAKSESKSDSGFTMEGIVNNTQPVTVSAAAAQQLLQPRPGHA